MEGKWTTIDKIKASTPNSIAMGPFGSRITTDNFVTEGVPVIRGNNLNGERFWDKDFVYLTEQKADELRSSNAFVGDIVITHRGTLGQVGIILPNARYSRYVVSQSQMKLTVDQSLADPLFVFYFLRSPQGQQALLANTSQTGVPAIARPTTSLKAIELPLPTIQEQRAIANILGTLDDKIELNRQMNQTLEAIAQALFKSWFVDFDPVRAKMEGLDTELSADVLRIFPDALVETELGLIPQGWAISTIGESVKVFGGSTPSTKNPAFWDGGIIPWATPKDLSGLSSPILLDTERKITQAGLDRISSGLLPAGTLLLSSRAPIGYLAISQVPVSINQGFIAMVCDGPVSNYFMLQWCKHYMEIIKGRANGTTFQEISKTNFRPIQLVIPPKPIADYFDKVVSPLYQRLASNLRENDTLAQIRETLLPKLLSGERSVREAEAAMEVR